MNDSQKLLLGRNIFTFIIVILFTIIIINEKSSTIFIPKVQEKMDTYLKENYKDLVNNLDTDTIKYSKSKYSMKVKNKDNNNLYFYIYYKNKKITDSYESDYSQGKTLLNHIRKNLEKEIKNTLKDNYKVEINTTLDNFTPKVQERIINEENLLQLKFYTLEKEIIINNWNEEEITNEIDNIIIETTEKNITPKYYNIIITDKNDITKSLKITNLTDDFSKNLVKKEIISAIINDDNSKLLEENKIEYTYLN